MKLKNFKHQQILKLHLLKSGIIQNSIKAKNQHNLLSDENLNQIFTDFKTVLHLILKYHKANKNILFIGIPKNLEIKINNLTNHVAIPTTFNLQSLFLNISSSRKLSLNKNVKNCHKTLLPKLQRKPDLLVIFSLNNDCTSNLLTSQAVKIPVIMFGPRSKNFQQKSCYTVAEIQKDSIANKNLFFIGLNFLIKVIKKNKNK